MAVSCHIWKLHWLQLLLMHMYVCVYMHKQLTVDAMYKITYILKISPSICVAFTTNQKCKYIYEYMTAN